MSTQTIEVAKESLSTQTNTVEQAAVEPIVVQSANANPIEPTSSNVVDTVSQVEFDLVKEEMEFFKSNFLQLKTKFALFKSKQTQLKNAFKFTSIQQEQE